MVGKDYQHKIYVNSKGRIININCLQFWPAMKMSLLYFWLLFAYCLLPNFGSRNVAAHLRLEFVFHLLILNKVLQYLKNGNHDVLKQQVEVERI